MQKKILFIITKSMWGGASRYVFDLATHLDKANFRVLVALGGDGSLSSRLEASTIDVLRIPSLERDINIIKEIRAMRTLWRIFYTEKPDIIHLNSSKVGFLGAFIARLSMIVYHYRSFVVFTVHGWAFKEDRPFYQLFFIRVIQWLTSILCDRVIIISHRDYQHALHMPFLKKEKFVYIPLAIPLDQQHYLPKQSARKELNKIIHQNIKSHRLFVVGTIAELTKNKGLEYLINATYEKREEFDKQNVKIFIIGSGENREKLESQIYLYDLQGTIFLLGFIPDAAKYLKAFDVFVLSSLKEGLPYTLIEALHAGLPVVGTRVGGIPDLIINKKNGLLVNAKSSSSIADALLELISQKQLLEHIAKQNKRLINEKISFNSMLRRTVMLYNRL